jgi:hypothetical protein
MPVRRYLLATMLVLVLVGALLALTACGQAEGQKAREVVDEMGRNALEFAEGFCGAIILAPLALGLILIRWHSHPRS